MAVVSFIVILVFLVVWAVDRNGRNATVTALLLFVIMTFAYAVFGPY